MITATGKLISILLFMEVVVGGGALISGGVYYEFYSSLGLALFFWKVHIYNLYFANLKHK